LLGDWQRQSFFLRQLSGTRLSFESP
jgi:hypothetical protein